MQLIQRYVTPSNVFQTTVKQVNSVRPVSLFPRDVSEIIFRHFTYNIHIRYSTIFHTFCRVWSTSSRSQVRVTSKRPKTTFEHIYIAPYRLVYGLYMEIYYIRTIVYHCITHFFYSLSIIIIPLPNRIFLVIALT